MEPFGDTAEQYAEFAMQARQESPCFEQWALGVAADEEVLALLGALPPVKQQPNLMFAAARWHGIPAPSPYEVLRQGLLANWEIIRATVLARSTQTNEVGRLATLVPAFAAIQARSGRPLALIEVGASAGLCLYPDRFGYRWRTRDRVVCTSPTADAPVLTCAVSGPAPLPPHVPVVGWRRGLDLNPLDVRNQDAMAWLRTLVWPEQHERRARLAAAVDLVRRDPPRLLRGDVFAKLPELISAAPPDHAVVVFHSAVLAYLEPEWRRQFSAQMSQLVAAGTCSWVSNESKRVLPELTATGPTVPDDLATFVLGVDGRAVAWTHGHGASMTWLSPGVEAVTAAVRA